MSTLTICAPLALRRPRTVFALGKPGLPVMKNRDLIENRSLNATRCLHFDTARFADIPDNDGGDKSGYRRHDRLTLARRHTDVVFKASQAESVENSATWITHMVRDVDAADTDADFASQGDRN